MGAQTARATRTRAWTARILSAIPVVMLLFSAAMKFTGSAQVLDEFVGRLGYKESAVTGIGLLEVGCTLLYVIPQTAVLGAVLLTGYLGGAVATHVRIGDPFFVVPLALGVLVWAGLYLREDRLKALLPLRKDAASVEFR